VTSRPLTTDFDLLREKRQELNLPEPVQVAVQGRQLLARGAAIGAALIGISLGAVVLVWLRALMVSAAVDRLGTVDAEVQLFETQLTAARGKLKRVDKANADLVKGLIAVRSGSALMRDLQLRVSRDPQAFARINAFQLQLKRSPLLDPNGVTLVKASRGAVETKSFAAGSGPVSFELLVNVRPPISPPAEKRILTQLGAEGLVRRLDLLQREGLL
jgi:type IV pilus assembly protein PilN